MPGPPPEPDHDPRADATAAPDDADAAYARELRLRVARDQAARMALLEGPPDDPGLLRRLAEVDRASAAWLRSALAEHGFPRSSRHGVEATANAWLLAQHADDDPGLQRRALELLREAVFLGEATPDLAAYLEDRIAVGEGRPQRYGTQFRAAGRYLEPVPIEDPDGVDGRRAAVGLPTLAQALMAVNDG